MLGRYAEVPTQNEAFFGSSEVSNSLLKIMKHDASWNSMTFLVVYLLLHCFRTWSSISSLYQFNNIRKWVVSILHPCKKGQRIRTQHCLAWVYLIHLQNMTVRGLMRSLLAPSMGNSAFTGSGSAWGSCFSMSETQNEAVSNFLITH